MDWQLELTVEQLEREMTVCEIWSDLTQIIHNEIGLLSHIS